MRMARCVACGWSVNVSVAVIRGVVLAMILFPQKQFVLFHFSK